MTQQAADFAQYTAAGEVAEAIVDLFEQVEIDEGHGEFQVITLGAANLLLQGDMQIAMIVETCQIIRVDQLICAMKLACVIKTDRDLLGKER